MRVCEAEVKMESTDDPEGDHSQLKKKTAGQ